MLKIYSSYSKQWFESNAAPYPNTSQSSIFCLNSDGSLLLVAEAGSALDGLTSRFPSPKRFVWLPSLEEIMINSPSNLSFGTLFSNSVVQLFCHVSDGFLYVGPAKRAGVVYHESVPREFGFSLETPLPKELWLKLGGYTDWLVMLNEKETINITNDKDIDGVIRKMEEKHSLRIKVTRYEDDTYSIFLLGDRGVVVYRAGALSLVSESKDHREAHETIEFSFTEEEQYSDYEFSSRYVVSRATAIEMLTRFLKEGSLSGLIPFQPVDSD